jgi:hypothetical protein
MNQGWLWISAALINWIPNNILNMQKGTPIVRERKAGRVKRGVFGMSLGSSLRLSFVAGSMLLNYVHCFL